MGTRQRAVMSLSLSPDTAKEYKEIAKTEGKTISGLFREMFFFYKQEKLKKEFFFIVTGDKHLLDLVSFKGIKISLEAGDAYGDDHEGVR